MAVFSERQIESLKLFDATFGSQPKLMQAGRNVADRMRTALPDLDDVTIGRVLLQAGDQVAGVVFALEQDEAGDGTDTTQSRAALNALVGALACAAIQLTEIHWREETP